MPNRTWIDAQRPVATPMRKKSGLIAAGACVLLVSSCTPAFNWRDVRLSGAELTVPFPCKPERATRSVAWFGGETRLHMLSCEHRGLTFAAGVLALPSGIEAADAHTGLQRAALASVRQLPERAQPWQPALSEVASGGPANLRGWTAEGQRPDGQPVRVHALTWVRNGHLAHLSIYGPVSPQTLEQWLEGLRADPQVRSDDHPSQPPPVRSPDS